MRRWIVRWGLIGLWLVQTSQAQEFKAWNRTVQVHGFFSQGFVYTEQNNWLTMNTTEGSGAMTEMGLEAWYRDVRLMRLYEGTSELLRVNIAKMLEL